jgi:hypothetical protein
MVRLALIFLIVLGAGLGSQRAKAEPRPELNNIITEPKVIQHDGKDHMVLNYGGLEMLHPVIKEAIPYPQCDVVQMLANKEEALVVVGNPKRFAMVIGKPIAMRTDHNKRWNEIVRQTFRQ